MSIVFWEFVQNLPLVTGFVLALRLWQQGLEAAAIVCAVAGSLTGAWLISVTESKIVQGHREPWRVVIANTATMSILIVLLVLYLSARWSNWQTDLVGGLLAGAGLGVIQAWAAGERIGVRHCIALACATPPALILLRTLTTSQPPVVNVLGITLIATLIVVLIDYSSRFRSTAQGEK